jgi:hypothetical protein
MDRKSSPEITKGVVHKLRLQEGVGSPKMSTFCQRLIGKKCQRMVVGRRWSKKPKTCQRT